MIEAVENHMPEVIIIDEMGTELEAAAARTIAERGVQLIATAHGNTLDNLIMNPTLSDLVGGVQSVTLGDDEARRRGTQKTILERKVPPTFDAVVEIQSWERVAIHDDVAQVVDTWLRGFPVVPETRWLDDSGSVHKVREAPAVHQSIDLASSHEFSDGSKESLLAKDAKTRVFLFGVGRDKVEQAANATGQPVQVVNDLQAADMVLTTKTHYRRGSQLVRVAETTGKPIYVLRKNTALQIEQFLKAPPAGQPVDGGVSEPALQEAHEAAQRVLNGVKSVVLSPQRAYVRRLQHILAERYHLASISSGRDPDRHVTYYRS